MSFGSLGDKIMGDKDAGSKAGKIQARAYGDGIDEQRRQFDFIRQLMAPYVEAGQAGIPGMTEGASLGGFASNLNEIMSSPELDPLRQQRMEAINSEFAKAGLLRSGARGNAIGRDLTDFSLGLESMLYGRQANLSGSGQNAAAGLGGFGQQTGVNISNLMGAQGEARGSGLLADAQARAAMFGQVMQAAPMAMMAFSDSRLKENIRERGNLGPLNVYEWDWIPELEAVGLKPTMNIGFLAEEVEELFPQHVHKIGAFKAVDYGAVLKKIEEVMH